MGSNVYFYESEAHTLLYYLDTFILQLEDTMRISSLLVLGEKFYQAILARKSV